MTATQYAPRKVFPDKPRIRGIGRRKERSGEEAIRDMSRKDPACRPVRLYRRSGGWFNHAPGGTSSRFPKIGSGGSDAAVENRKHFVYGELHCKEKHSTPAVPSREKSLAIRFNHSIQSSNDSHGVCVLYTISGGSRYRVVSRRTEPPGSSSSTNSCDILPPGGSVVTFGSRLSIPGSPPSPALAPVGALSAHIKTQSSIRYLWHNDPILDATIIRRAGRIGRRRLEWIRSAFRKSRLHKITTNGKEGCGTGGDTRTASRRRIQVVNHRNRRSPCRKEY